MKVIILVIKVFLIIYKPKFYLLTVRNNRCYRLIYSKAEKILVYVCVCIIMNWWIYITFVHLFTDIYADEKPSVTIEDGLIRGSFKESYNGRKYIAFEGIPYAQPPVGKLRFEDPQPVQPWLGILEATTTYTCLQFGLEEKVYGDEDCLYLNVYVPRETINSKDKMEIIVHIHGGAFMIGSPSLLAGPTKIMDRDVIYVNLNYRLGPFGFYSIGDGRGNYGLKDQVAALQWIQKNIEKFGGNKNSVTITGLSAGGASVHLHYFSSLSKGLFNNGFAQSGVALNPWAVRQDPSRNAKILAKEVGCNGDSIENIYTCMKQRSGLQIANSIKALYDGPLLPLVLFGPIIEKNSSTAFLVKMPYLQLVDKELKDAPLLISTTTEEGTTPAALMYRRLDEVNKNWKKWFPLMLEYYESPQYKRDEISEKIRKFYFKDELITKENFRKLIEACTYRIFHIGEEKAAKLQAHTTKSNVYFLLTSYVGDVKSMDVFQVDINLGAGHGFDGKFYYAISFVKEERLNKEEEKMKDVLLDMLVSFAKTGKPTIKSIEFQPVSKSGNLTYLFVTGPDDLSMKTTEELGPYEFWKSLGIKEDENSIEELIR